MHNGQYRRIAMNKQTLCFITAALVILAAYFLHDTIGIWWVSAIILFTGMGVALYGVFGCKSD
jgi:hypothetical protein